MELINTTFKLNHPIFEIKLEDELDRDEINARYSMAVDIVMSCQLTSDLGLMSIKDRVFKIEH